MIDEERPPMMGGILIYGPNYWGWGEDIPKAKASYRKAGGNLTWGYVVYSFPPTCEFKYVDNMGAIHWEGDGDAAIIDRIKGSKTSF